MPRAAVDAPPTSHWVMPAANEPKRSRFRMRLIVPAVLVLAFVIAAVLDASPVAPYEGPTGVTGAALSTFDLRVGECFDLETTDGGETITDVFRRACDRAHQYELFLTAKLTGVGYPSDTDMDVYFEDECVPAFTEYVGAPYESSSLDIYWLVPSRDGWREGDRTIQCAVYHPDLPRLTAPLKGIGPGGTWTGPSA